MYSRILQNRSTLSLVLVATLASAAIAGAVVKFAPLSAIKSPAIGPGALDHGVRSQGTDRVEAELLVLRSDGFKPNEITRPPGRFLLALQNHSSEEELSLVLKRETGDSVREVRMAKRQSKFKEFLHLPPGRYVLVETKHPEWTCTITIKP